MCAGDAFSAQGAATLLYPSHLTSTEPQIPEVRDQDLLRFLLHTCGNLPVCMFLDIHSHTLELFKDPYSYLLLQILFLSFWSCSTLPKPASLPQTAAMLEHFHRLCLANALSLVIGKQPWKWGFSREHLFVKHMYTILYICM